MVYQYLLHTIINIILFLFIQNFRKYTMRKKTVCLIQLKKFKICLKRMRPTTSFIR